MRFTETQSRGWESLHLGESGDTRELGDNLSGSPHLVAQLLQRGHFKGSTSPPTAPLGEEQVFKHTSL